MATRQRARGAEQPEPKAPQILDPHLRELLDHVARQLAEEYVRLMTKAGHAECGAEELTEDVTR